MKILALEFSTLRRSAAVLDLIEGQATNLAAVTETPPEHKRSGSPFELLAKLFGSEIQPDEIEGIVIGLGPGSYTGIRSALAIAQGWNLARAIPAAGVSSADAIAFKAWSQKARGTLEVVIDAQKGEVYSATYDLSDVESDSTRAKAPTVQSNRKVIDGIIESKSLHILRSPENAHLLAGPDALKLHPSGLSIFPDADSLGRLISAASFGPVEHLEPIYLREPSFVKAPAVRHA